MAQVIVYVKLVKTSAFKTSIKFAIGYAVLAIAALVAVYVVTIFEMESQIDRELIQEINELIRYEEHEGIHELIEKVEEREQFGQYLHHYYAITDKHRNLIAGNLFLTHDSAIVTSVDQRIQLFKNLDSHFTHEEEFDNVLRGAITTVSGNKILIVGQTSYSIAELKEHTASAVVIIIVITLVLSLMTSVYMGKAALKKVNQLDKQLSIAIKSHFKHKIPVPEEADEFQALTIKLNLMLMQIEKLFVSMRQVTDNVAHDLRSPLSRMRSRLEVTLLQSRDEAEYVKSMQQAIDDCDELLQTFNALLSIAQAESGVDKQSFDKINISELTEQLAEFYSVVAEEAQLTLHWTQTQPIYISANKTLLTQAISNLIENSIKYTPSSGTITLVVDYVNHQPRFSINDSGPGIPANERERVLERFQRLDSTRNSKGNGLGLSLVKAVADLHHAKFVLRDNNPGLSASLIFQNIA